MEKGEPDVGLVTMTEQLAQVRILNRSEGEKIIFEGIDKLVMRGE